MSRIAPDSLVRSAGTGDGRVVLQDSRRTLLFEDPVEIITIMAPQDVESALAFIDSAVYDRGLYAAGYLSYEASSAFDLAAHDAPADELPLLWFGLYHQARELQVLVQPRGEYHMGAWQVAVEWPLYRQAIDAIKAYIAKGDTYQVNYTMPLYATFHGDPWSLFQHLAESQQAHYMAYLDLGRYVVCSASPELFFERQGDRLLARPMKGTAARGRTLDEDRAQIAWLRDSEKNRAENVMIVDMIRNDFGRIARIGSVTVPELFTVERYPTVLQMTSTVAAHSDATLPQIMRAMFPCASITGAPKVRTMEIIKELEPAPRGI
ncbi:MAG: chorismate-binding protein, partial [Candidatus Promineifilaceae bacterium]